ncbi:MAG: hypothetical protein E6Q97_11515 [Desulfurellales bacterium]|nr:MAG: hypothetical protein E6Q97_11515 [Desulfurellales bacterium]
MQTEKPDKVKILKAFLRVIATLPYKHMLGALFACWLVYFALFEYSQKPPDAKPEPTVDLSKVPPNIHGAAGPEPRINPWNGVPFCVDRHLKQVLNDYDSSEYLQASAPRKVWIEKTPYWEVNLRLRAKNAFGAYIVTVKTFHIQNEQVIQMID